MGAHSAEQSVLLEAEAIIHGQRRADYGGALESFDRVARLWAPLLGVEVTAEQVALCLIQLKVARALNGLRSGALHRDSVVDIAGYAGCLEMIAAERTEVA